MRTAILRLFCVFAFAGAGFAQCTLSQTDPSVTICTPAPNATVTSPIHIVAGTTSSSAVSTMKIYLDGTGVYTVNASSLDTSLTAAAGTHRITVKAWNQARQVFSSTENVTVSSASGGGGGGGTGACPGGSASPSVNICSPAPNSTITSPIHVTAGTTSPTTVTTMKIYLDGTGVYTVSAGSIDTSIAASAGAHRITVKAWNQGGQVFSSTENVTVSSSTGGGGGGGGTGTCSPGSTSPSVNICTPANGASVPNPVHITAATNSSTSVSTIKVYINGTGSYTVNASTLDVSLNLPVGPDRITVKAWNSGGQVFSSTINISVTGSGGGSGDISAIKHILFFVQENRSFDNYFGQLGAYRSARGFTDAFDGTPNKTIPDKAGHQVAPFHQQTVCTENTLPDWNHSHTDYDGGLMDKFLKEAPSSTIDPDGTYPIGYYNQTDLNYYYELAFQFATSDRFFSPMMGPTVPNRMYLFTGTSFGHIHSDPPPSGGFTQPTIFHALSKAGIKWRYYYQDNSVFLAQFSDWSTESGHVFPISQYYTDVQSDSTLPQVVFFERGSQLNTDEHPLNNIQTGAAAVAKVLNALLASPAWRSSVFLLTYDEGGGMYDHVPPISAPTPDDIPPMLQSGDINAGFNQTGFRVPLIVVSPFTKPHYVSHTPTDYTAILKLIETRFGVPPLTRRDAWASDMTEYFDFTTPQWMTPPNLPAQSTSGACDKTLEKAPGH